MTDRFVTIQTSDHGALTIPEPPWCRGGHPDGGTRDEISHLGPSIDITVGTDRGPRRLVEAMLWQDPFPTPRNPHRTAVYVVVHLLDGDHFGYDVAGLEGLATDLIDAARRVRLVAKRLSAETPRGDR